MQFAVTLPATTSTSGGDDETAISIETTSISSSTSTTSTEPEITGTVCELIDACEHNRARDALGHISPPTPATSSEDVHFPSVGSDRNANDQVPSHKMAPTLTSSSVASVTTTATASVTPSSTATSGTSPPLLPGFGLAYSALTGTPGHAICKNASTITSELTTALTSSSSSSSGIDYSFIRLYSTTCDQTALTLTVARSHHLRVLAAIENPSNAAAEAAEIAAAVTSAADGDWSSIHSVAVGNEVVAWPAGGRDTGISFSELHTGVAAARSALHEAGYAGPVVTVDAWTAWLAMPELCDLSDYAAANCHAFFDGGVPAAEAGEWVVGQVGKVAAACGGAGGKEVLITESGWPWKGRENGVAVPGVEEQKVAVESLRSAFEGIGGGVVMFEATDDGWKAETEGAFGVEPYWGMKGGKG